MMGYFPWERREIRTWRVKDNTVGGQKVLDGRKVTRVGILERVSWKGEKGSILKLNLYRYNNDV